MRRVGILGLMFVYAATGSAGDVLLSHGMRQLALLVLAIAIVCFALNYGLFLGLLRKMPGSVVIPAQASSCVLTVAASYLALRETIPNLRWMGAILISAGVTLILLSDRDQGA